MEINSIPFLFMTALELKQELHELIEQADERVVRLVYSMLKADQELPDGHKQILDERLKEYQSKPGEVLTLQDIKKKYSRKDEPGSI